MAADNGPVANPTLNSPHKYSDRIFGKFLHASGKLRQQAKAHAPQSDEHGHEKGKEPAGGFDSTPIPAAPPGYTVKITFHRAYNLPFADFSSLSSDPFLVATLKTDLPKRHRQDPDLVFRTPTVRRNTNPEWNSVWTVAHIPHSGFTMKIRLYDEDPADHDDRLGNVQLRFYNISEGWTGQKEQICDIKKRMASKRAYLIRGCAAMILRNVKMNGELVVSVESLGSSEGEGGRAYTLGPLPWTRHYSPLIGRLTGTKERSETEDGTKKPEKYNFQAIQMQLAGPVPPELYHRYVEFKPYIAGMFSPHSIQGLILNRMLHHQHNRIYNFDRSTLYGVFQKPCIDMTKQFLDFVHYDHGGRIFTYILTLDAQLRFTETGKEFGIDMLSKHTMHSDVSIYIAFSGEFFVRRLRKPRRAKEKQTRPRGSSRSEDGGDGGDDNDSNPESNLLPPEAESDTEDDSKPNPQGADSSTDPANYELIIDNDSGTYRPNAKYLPNFRNYMRRSLPGIRIVTLDCQADAEKMGRLKQEQADRKKATKGSVQYLQRGSESSSISSSDEEDLDELERKNRAGNEGEDKQGRERRLKQSVEVATAGIKKVVAGAACGGGGEKSERSGEGCGGMGGVLGEDGPVRMREEKDRVKAEEGPQRDSKGGDGAALKESTPAKKSEGMSEREAELVSNVQDGSETVDGKEISNGQVE